MAMRQCGTGVRLLLGALAVCWANAAVGADSKDSGDGAAPEPNADIACGWWPEFENVWTPIGWKNHPFRFNVLYNGMVVSEPQVNYNKFFGTDLENEPFFDQGFQLTFIPSVDGTVSGHESGEELYRLAARDGGVGHQGWRDGATPVLWTEWQESGLELRKEIFAHLPGAGPVSQGIEPLYAWIRLSVRQKQAGIIPDRYGWLIKINKPHIRKDMLRKRGLTVDPAKSAYPRALSIESPGRVAEDGCRVIEPDGKIRLAIAPGSDGSVRFVNREPNGKDVFLYVQIPAESGAHVDLLVPVLLADRSECDEELALGFEKALAESEGYWSQLPATAAKVVTPERLVNEAFRHGPKFAEVIAVRHPTTDQYGLLLSTWHYERLWSTPGSMVLGMLLDTVGYHSVVDRYLELFRQNQGKCVAPGPAYKLHPGYLTTPKTMTGVEWLTDHGALLHVICQHALLTDDRAFIDRWTEGIVKACEFIKDSRAITSHGGVEGLLPAAAATDRAMPKKAAHVKGADVPTEAANAYHTIPVQAVWSDGWNYKGLTTAIRLLKRIGHPRAAEFTEEARAYKEAFVKAIREATQRMPKWVDGRQGYHLVPTAFPDGGEIIHRFYLDTGPAFLVFAGLMDADDELMQSTLLYFREGPNAKVYDIRGHFDQPPSLRHELSSCEPAYSWNIYHSHQSQDRYRFLEGMYSLFAGAMSRQTFISCEHRGGISGIVCAAAVPIYLARLAVIDDQIQPGRLHLLRLVPLAWIKAGEPTMFENMPTEFGPMTLQFTLHDEGKSLNISFKPTFRHEPDKILLHVPPVPGLKEMIVNGRVFKAKSGDVVLIRAGN